MKLGLKDWSRFTRVDIFTVDKIPTVKLITQWLEKARKENLITFLNQLIFL